MINTHSTVSRYLPMLLALAVFMQMLDATILNTALPTMATDLHESPLQMQSAVISYALTLALFMPLSGYLCDRYGTKKVFFVALLLFVAGSLLCALASSLNSLVMARILQGMGGAMLTPIPRMVLVRTYAKQRLVTMLNYVIMPALIGPVVGPIAGGYLVQYASWHWIFLINLPFGLLAAFLTLKIMPEFKSTSTTPPFDLTGFILFGGGTVGLSLAIESAHHANASGFAMLTATLSLLSLVLYWQHSQKIATPLYSYDLFKVRTFRLGLLGNLASRLGMSAIPFLLPLLLQVSFGRSATESGWTMAPVALASIAAKPFIQPLMRLLGYRRLLISNTWIIGLTIASFALTSHETPLWILLPQLLALGLCNSIQFTAMNALMLADLAPTQANSGSSLMSVNQQLSIGFGIALGATILQYFSNTNLLHQNIQAAFKLTFLSMGLITILSSFVFAQLQQQDGENLVNRKT